MLPSIQLFSAYFQPFPIWPNAAYVTPVQAGAANASTRLQMQGDDTGENISAQNHFYSELTVAYWVMKNADRAQCDAWGLSHYRRYLIQDRYKLFFKKRSRYYFRTSQQVLDSILTPELYDAMRRLEAGEPHIYVCGLERMVSAVRHLARKEMGLPRERVHSERYD